MSSKPQKPRAPRSLGPAGQRFWRDMVEEIEFGPHELRILRDAAATVDTIVKLEEAARDLPVRSKGSMGQPVIAPEIAELRVQRALLASLIARLKVPDLNDTPKGSETDAADVLRRRFGVSTESSPEGPGSARTGVA